MDWWGSPQPSVLYYLYGTAEDAGLRRGEVIDHLGDAVPQVNGVEIDKQAERCRGQTEAASP